MTGSARRLTTAFTRRLSLIGAGIALVVMWGQDKLWALGGDARVLETVSLPSATVGTSSSLEQALAQRRSLRDFAADPLSLDQLSQVLWGAQGLSDAAGYRTAPSAGALYPLEIYVLVGRVIGLDPGVYKYRAASHDLVRTGEGDLRAEAAEIALGQSWVAAAPAILVVAAVFARTTAKYGRRGERYVYMEAGHAAQNVYLQATALDLGVTVVGAFDDVRLHGLVGMERDESPLSLLPLGTTS